MSTANGYLTVAGINVDVVYKNIKNMHISVYPPIGRVRVAAPDRIDEDAIRLAVVQRLPWIKKQREQLQAAERQSEREMVTGESHYVWGQRLRLKLVEGDGRPKVEVVGSKLQLSVPVGMDGAHSRRFLESWYRKQMKAALSPLVEKWEPIIGLKVNGWTVRRMKTKWGSCNPESANLWFNVELAKKHPACLEYIVVHEMMHFHERTHNDRFVELMDKHLPNWRATRDLLNGAPLAEEDWPE
ncbi:MAG: SprT family zinc-dependent metalloprotease [Actinomycetota bacterium]